MRVCLLSFILLISDVFGAGPHTDHWQAHFRSCTVRERAKCKQKINPDSIKRGFFEGYMSYTNRKTLASAKFNECASIGFSKCVRLANIAEKKWLKKEFEAGRISAEEREMYLASQGEQNAVANRVAMQSVENVRSVKHDNKVMHNHYVLGVKDEQFGVKIDCEKCRPLLNQAYGVMRSTNQDEIRKKLSSVNTCIDRTIKDYHLPLSRRQARIALEMLGQIPAMLIEKDQPSPYSKDNIAKQKKLIEDAANSAKEVAFDPTGVWGSSNCLTHANRLADHLRSKLNSDQFHVTVVNTYKNIPSGSRISMNAIAPISNHFMARVTNKQTGVSYVVDAYLGVKVKVEDDEVQAGRLTVFSDYEDCFFSKVYAQRMGRDPGEGLVGMLLGVTPSVAIFMSREAKQAANSCRSGSLQTYESSDYFNNTLK